MISLETPYGVALDPVRLPKRVLLLLDRLGITHIVGLGCCKAGDRWHALCRRDGDSCMFNQLCTTSLMAQVSPHPPGCKQLETARHRTARLQNTLAVTLYTASETHVQLVALQAEGVVEVRVGHQTTGVDGSVGWDRNAISAVGGILLWGAGPQLLWGLVVAPQLIRV